MDLRNYTTDISVRENVLNITIGATVISTTKVYLPSLTLFILCLLGIPGNVLVIVMYVRLMTTSTRVYMFALAVVDLFVCVCGVFFTGVELTQVAVYVLLVVGDISLIFSVLLLAFVSTERLAAVRRPHEFNLTAARAKKVLCLIFFAAAVVTTIHSLLQSNNYDRSVKMVEAFIFLSCFSTMSICYALIAVTLLKRSWSARKQVASNGGVNIQQPSAISTVVFVNNATVAPVPGVLATNAASVKAANAQRGLRVLFVITLVFVACWLPNIFSNSPIVENLVLVNSMVNPYIYSFVSRKFRDDVRQWSRKIRSKICWM